MVKQENILTAKVKKNQDVVFGGWKVMLVNCRNGHIFINILPFVIIFTLHLKFGKQKCHSFEYLFKKRSESCANR